MTALADLAEKIGTAAALATSLADLRREEHQRTALYGVALQLTGRAELRELLDLITKHARELLGAERAVACLADPRIDGHSVDWTDRLAIADDGSTCLLAHPSDESGRRSPQPGLPGPARRARADVLARPLHGADGFLGELCVMRSTGVPFTDRDRELLGALADMAAIAVGTARLREAEQQYTIVAERDRIARELHDSIAQVLGVIHLRLRSLEPEVQDVPGNGVATEISDLAEIADEAYKDVREAILGLRESVTSADGLEGALGEYLRKYSRQTGIKATLHCNGSARRALTPRSEIQLLRVVQEALTNVRKHAGARIATVNLNADDGVVLLEVKDDGSGFDPGRLEEALDHGFGLASMRERVEQIGGTLAVHTAPGQGTRVEVRLQQRSSVPHTPPSLRVLLVDDQPLFRKALAGLVNAQLDMTVVGEADNGLEALDRVRAQTPDVVDHGREHAHRRRRGGRPRDPRGGLRHQDRHAHDLRGRRRPLRRHPRRGERLSPEEHPPGDPLRRPARRHARRGADRPRDRPQAARRAARGAGAAARGRPSRARATWP